MPGGLSQNGFLGHPGGAPGNVMAPAPPYYQGASQNGEGWQKERQLPRGPMNAQQRMQQPQNWQDDVPTLQGWQGQLGPNLMPLPGPATSQNGGIQNMRNQEAPINGMHHVQPRNGGMHNMRKQEFPTAGIQSNQHGFPNGGMQELRSPPNGGMQNMQGMEFQSGAMHDMRNMQNLGMQDLQGRRREEVSSGMQMPQMQQGSNMQSPPMMQIITLPPGASPPEGAIPIGPVHQAGTMPTPGPGVPGPGGMAPAGSLPASAMPAPAIQEPMNPPTFQVIAVPMGEAPPEGAIPVEQFSAAAPQTDQAIWGQSAHREKKVFKITDPRTGREVCGPGEEGARRRMRIINPRTGEEVRPNL